jgi:hypothetical protein
MLIARRSPSAHPQPKNTPQPVGLDYSVALGSFGVTWPVLQAEIIAA